MSPPRLQAVAVTKSYGATTALENVSLDLAAGEVHAVLGENGAGKSTLVKILSGVIAPNSGQMRLDGAVYAPHSILHARQAGVATAFQELSLAPNLTVAEALLLPAMKRGAFGLVSPYQTARAAAEILHRYRLDDVSPIAGIASLSLAHRQRLEIARAMHYAEKVLILDEPTAALTDVEWLFDLVRSTTAAGTAVLYISHRLAEVRTLCKQATVLRNGRSVASVGLSDASDADIFELMVGRTEMAHGRRTHSFARETRSALELNNVTGAKLKGVTLDVKEGEIVGIAALEGQG
ncbi:ATP-binding cassette domain-containing protein, partial [Mesorhizobium sp. M7A.F.Ca.AU.002.02.1.1]